MVSKHADYEKHRVLYISPLGVSLTIMFAAGVSVFFVHVLYVFGVGRDFDWGAVWPPAVGVFAATLLTAWIFNLIAPLLGGVPVWLRSDSPTEAIAEDVAGAGTRGDDFMKLAPGTSERKACPACNTRVRADGSFCPDCGHDFF